MEVEELFRDFQHYRKHTAHFRKLKASRNYLRDLKLNRDRREALLSMVAWCSSKSLDPRWWLYSLFSSRCWVASPRWDQLIPRTAGTERRAIERYKNLQAAPLLTERVDEQLKVSRSTFDVNRDISGTAENRKRVHVSNGDYDRCMSEAQSHTFGYHPKSSVCSQCPASMTCVVRLRSLVPFDIVALRRGDLSLDEAKRIAGRYYEQRG